LDYFTILSDALLSQLVVRLGETGEAAEVYERLRPYPEWVIPFHIFPAPSVSFHLGLLAGFLRRFDEAVEHFTQAMTDHKVVGAPTYVARTRLEWARALLAGGNPADRERARNLLNQALGVARQSGLLNVERRAGELLATL
jgi:hypothetical protein